MIIPAASQWLSVTHFAQFHNHGELRPDSRCSGNHYTIVRQRSARRRRRSHRPFQAVQRRCHTAPAHGVQARSGCSRRTRARCWPRTPYSYGSKLQAQIARDAALTFALYSVCSLTTSSLLFISRACACHSSRDILGGTMIVHRTPALAPGCFSNFSIRL